MGPTKVFKFVPCFFLKMFNYFFLKRDLIYDFLRTIYEQPDTIRGQWGTTDTRNATHGSGW